MAAEPWWAAAARTQGQGVRRQRASQEPTSGARALAAGAGEQTELDDDYAASAEPAAAPPVRPAAPWWAAALEAQSSWTLQRPAAPRALAEAAEDAGEQTELEEASAAEPAAGLEDGPGRYTIIHAGTFVSDQVALPRDATEVTAYLPLGLEVVVLEVERAIHLGRVRGRLENPHGWISLLNLETGYRWAKALDGDPDQGVQASGHTHSARNQEL